MYFVHISGVRANPGQPDRRPADNRHADDRCRQPEKVQRRQFAADQRCGARAVVGRLAGRRGGGQQRDRRTVGRGHPAQATSATDHSATAGGRADDDAGERGGRQQRER